MSDGRGQAVQTGGKSRRQVAWEKLMLRLLSLEPGAMYTITIAIDDSEGFIVGSIESRGRLERWGAPPQT